MPTGTPCGPCSAPLEPPTTTQPTTETQTLAGLKSPRGGRHRPGDGPQLQGELTDLTNLIVSAIAWAVRVCFPPTGRRRARPPAPRLAAERSSTTRAEAPSKAGAGPEFGDLAAMVRPYLLAHEESMRRSHRPFVVCARLGAVSVPGVCR